MQPTRPQTHRQGESCSTCRQTVCQVALGQEPVYLLDSEGVFMVGFMGAPSAALTTLSSLAPQRSGRTNWAYVQPLNTSHHPDPSI